jgi:flagellar hook-associated protein 1 FlgK
MSVSTALSNALSGLVATSRRAELVSDNVANALTEGYAAREARLESRGLSGGVRIVEISRRGDPELRTRLRHADAELAGGRRLSEAAGRISAAIGMPGETRSLAARAAAFETALGRLADTPESVALQIDAVDAAASLAKSFVTASREVQSVRGLADAEIGRLVDEANTALVNLEDLNRRIVRAKAGGGAESRGLAALEDSRDGWLDRLGEIIPIRTARRSDGDMMVYAPGGAVLLEGKAQRLDFSPAAAMTADSTLVSGGLSGLTLDGRAVDVGSEGPLSGGGLGAAFEIRDSLGVEAQTRLDALAEDLILRFEDPALDPTLAPGAAGLFTDGGAAFSAPLRDGLAGRLEINAAVDRSRGGDPARLRDGLGPGTPGPAGDPTLPLALLSAMRVDRAAPTGSGLSRDGGAAALAEGVAGLAAQIGADADARAAEADGRRTILGESEAASRGVDVDSELARLLVIEQAYAANARVVSTADELLKTLLEI